MNDMKCLVCGEDLRAGLASWHRVCQRCGYEQSKFKPAINAIEVHQYIDEGARENGLKALRKSNFESLSLKLKQLLPSKKARLLDVGAAHGWFLDAAAGDFDVLGIEPDEVVFAVSNSRGKPIRLGYFPEALLPGECFDVITFNDVIEHMPDIRKILDACHEHLNQSGLLLLNLPSSRGTFYRAAKLLHRFGIRGLFERLWQKDMPSPHVHYFHLRNLNRLVSQHGFTEVCRGTLPSLRLSGLFTRISYAGKQNIIARSVLYCLVVMALPLLKYLPADIVYSIYVRK